MAWADLRCLSLYKAMREPGSGISEKYRLPRLFLYLSTQRGFISQHWESAAQEREDVDTVLIRKYGWVAVLGLLMAVALVVFLLTYHVPGISQLTFTERVQGMEIKPFHDEVDDVYYLFLPAYVNKEQVDITMPEDVSIHFSVNGQDYGSSLARLPLQEPVELSISVPHHPSEKCTIELLQSKNIPTLFIETGEGGVENVLLNKSNKTRASVTTINPDGWVVYCGMSTLTGRGNGTWEQGKRPFNLKFARPTTVINKNDSAKTWCLLANYTDDSQIRNSICYHIARDAGIPYTSDIYFVSLYVNGEYQGLYNSANKQGYIRDVNYKVAAVFELTRKDRVYDEISERGFYFRARFGDVNTIRKTIDSFESALYSGTASYQQLEQYADLRLLAIKFFVESLCANYDIKLSQYYILNEEGKISPICAWDYDNTFGISPLYPDFAFNQIAISHPWYNALFEYNEFRYELLDILPQYSSLLQDAVNDYTDSICRLIGNDWMSNTIRWRNYVSPKKSNKSLKSKEYDFSTLRGHSIYINDFMKHRLQFLSEYWSAPEMYCRLMFGNEGLRQLGNTITLLYHKGDTLTEVMLPDGLLTMPDEGFEGWYTKDGTSVTDVGVITEDMSFEERLAPSPRTTALMKKVLHKAWLLSLIAVFGCLSLWLFVKAVLIPIKEAKR